MKAGLLLRIGIHLIGIWWLYAAASSGIYYVHLYFNSPASDELGALPVRMVLGGVFSHCVVPFLFAIASFGFARSIQRKLLGAEGESPIAENTFAPAGLLAIGCRILGLYLIATFGAYMIATLYEMVAIRAGGGPFLEGEVTSDAIANVVGLVAGVTLARRTDWVLRWCGIVAGSAETKPQS